MIIPMNSARSPRWESLLAVVAVVAPLLAVASLPFAAGQAPVQSSQPVASKSVPRLFVRAHKAVVFEPPKLADPVIETSAHQLFYIDLYNGEYVASTSARYQRPALSISKLYIADYVLDHGSEKEQAMALEMLRSSSDKKADVLFDAYPYCIDRTAKKYGLASTETTTRWGYSYTSAFDVASFLSQLIANDPDSPILQALSTAHQVAEDGTKQNFGTALLPGVMGTKWGWSDEDDLHSSASFGITEEGHTFVAVAMVAGSAKDLSHYVERQEDHFLDVGKPAAANTK